ncbi:hypothetical protein ABZ328_22105 [Micromonospora aurantiaca]|uniref:hypothetical protein n=1 Tax=Micromonospora aurantiaca (nom. illeg.) TaxID=47850 RepID=UPI0033EA7948
MASSIAHLFGQFSVDQVKLLEYEGLKPSGLLEPGLQVTLQPCDPLADRFAVSTVLVMRTDDSGRA